MKNEFSKELMKQLLIEVRELMEMISAGERFNNNRLMKKYESLFIQSLKFFKAEEVWRH